ncbi:MAG: M20 family metallopeptidase [Clostridia bacterium]|nr:M20 family metallopeptidase [Clostridia bacterium]
MNGFEERARAIEPELCAIREALHRCPEPGNAEFRTAEQIERALGKWGIATERVLGTAVVGTLKGAFPGKTVALRADMDALPLTEQTGAPFASENAGWMHACGHDVHMTAVLGAARLLAERRDLLHGTVLFVFEPDEEGSGGAARLCDSGRLDGVDAVFGAHVDPTLPAGTVGVRYGKFYAASDTFDVTVHGKSAHGATPELGRDALAAAVETIARLRALPERVCNDRCVLTVGTFSAGTARNILADTATFAGILRTLGPDERRRMKAALRETVTEAATATGTTAELTLRESYGGVVNHDTETALAEQAARETLGAARVVRIDRPTMTTEDFGVYLEHAGGSFYHIGAGCTLPLHHPGFLPEAEAFVAGAAVHAAVAERFLNGTND